MSADDDTYRATPDAPAPSDASTRWARAWAWLLVHRDGLGLFAFVACFALASTCAWSATGWFFGDRYGGACCVLLLMVEAVAGGILWMDPTARAKHPEFSTGGALIMLAAFVTGTALAVLGAVLS